MLGHQGQTLTRAAPPGDLAGIRDLLGSVADLVKNVGFRTSAGDCRASSGSGPPCGTGCRRARGLRLLFHLRAEREDMTFETNGVRYFDARDLLGFVDGTANPAGAEIADAALIGPDADADFAGGSYVVVQKYLHDLGAWNALATEEQGAIMGRTKIDNVEIDDDAAPRKSHKLPATIADPPGGELTILRDNMTFGRPGAGEPPGAYDRLLDFSTAVSGTTFFVPTAPMPEALATPAARRRRRPGSGRCVGRPSRPPAAQPAGRDGQHPTAGRRA